MRWAKKGIGADMSYFMVAIVEIIGIFGLSVAKYFYVRRIRLCRSKMSEGLLSGEEAKRILAGEIEMSKSLKSINDVLPDGCVYTFRKIEHLESLNNRAIAEIRAYAYP